MTYKHTLNYSFVQAFFKQIIIYKKYVNGEISNKELGYVTTNIFYTFLSANVKVTFPNSFVLSHYRVSHV